MRVFGFVRDAKVRRGPKIESDYYFLVFMRLFKKNTTNKAKENIN